MLSLSRFEHLLFGHVTFNESEEFLAFQFRFLVSVMVSSAWLTLVFVAAGLAGTHPMDNPHLWMMEVFSGVTLALWALLRGHKERFRAVAWVFLMLCQLEYVSALMHVPEDELRVLWFFTNVPGVYLLLGRKVGLSVSVLTGVGLAMGNPMLSRPYSPHAMATLLGGYVYLTLFFHLYASRSISYFKRMRHFNDRLQEQASHDPLTGVLNARAYYAWCDRWLLSALRSGAPCSVLFVDLDHFKRINDQHGHAAGDAVLRAVADTLQQGIRRSDVLARIGGEEFSIFLPDTDSAHAVMLAEKLRVSVEALSVDAAGRTLNVTASIGVASGEGASPSMSGIQRQADQAMYRAKAAGRNRVSCLEGEGRVRALSRHLSVGVEMSL